MRYFKEILEQKNWWFVENDKYHIDDDWIIEMKYPAPYPAFKWWEQHTYRSTLYYLRVVLRELTDEKIANTKTNHFKKRYSVIVKAAEGCCPISINHWEEKETPWRSFSCYFTPFYGGRKYKYEFEYDEEDSDEPRDGVTHSALRKGFDDLVEARKFAEKWKEKLLNDHIEVINKERELLKDIVQQN